MKTLIPVPRMPRHSPPPLPLAPSPPSGARGEKNQDLREELRSLVVAALVLCLSAACSRQPHSIQVKLPTESFQTGHAAPPPPVLRQQGATLALRASAFDAQGTFMGPARVSWASADPSTLAVDAQGLVTALSTGATQITATHLDFPALSNSLTLQARIVGSVRIVPPSPDFQRLRLGEKQQLRAEVLDDREQLLKDAKVFWSNPDHGVWITPSGEISGAAVGETVVVAQSEGKSAELTFNVVE